MQKKLTLSIVESVCFGLHDAIGPRRTSKFIEDLVRPHVFRQNLETAYAQMAQDELREKEALEWSEATVGDSVYEQG